MNYFDKSAIEEDYEFMHDFFELLFKRIQQCKDDGVIDEETLQKIIDHEIDFLNRYRTDR